jgi:simple sugar transport system permease protein
MTEEIGLWGVPIAILGGAIRVSTAFLFVSLGECLTERSGRINLGLEGTLVFGAMSGYAMSYESGHALIGVLAAAIAGALFGLAHGWICKFKGVNDFFLRLAFMNWH